MFWGSFICLLFFKPVFFIAGYPANVTLYPVGYRISKKAGYPAGRLFGATLDKMSEIISVPIHTKSKWY